MLSGPRRLIGRPATSGGTDSRYWKLLVVVVCISSLVGCPHGFRRADERETSEESEETADDRIERRDDPRFPHDNDERRGFWVQEPQNTGFVSPSRLASSVARRLDDLREACCRAGTACADLDARIVLELELRGDGRVRDARLAESDVGRPGIVECIVGKARKWRLAAPENGQSATVNVPVRIRTSSGGSPGTDAG